jgi:hypothetical protein
MLVPLVVGGILVARDVVYRLIRGFQAKPIKHEKMTYGPGGDRDASCPNIPLCPMLGRPLLPRVYPGPLPHLQKRQACWRQKVGLLLRGRYCQRRGIACQRYQPRYGSRPEAKLRQPSLSRRHRKRSARRPLDSAWHLGGGLSSVGWGIWRRRYLRRIHLSGESAVRAKVVLSMAQRKERCRNCVIYNEHQREKYKILMPVFLVGYTGGLRCLC